MPKVPNWLLRLPRPESGTESGTESRDLNRCLGSGRDSDLDSRVEPSLI